MSSLLHLVSAVFEWIHLCKESRETHVSNLSSIYIDKYLELCFMTTCSVCEYSVFVQIMSGDELSDMHNEDRQAEPSLTQMLQAFVSRP